MKQLLLLAFLTILSTSLRSQTTLRIDANGSERHFDQEELTDYWQEFVAHRHITNTSNRYLSLQWNLEIMDAPDAWEFRVCDQNASYAISREGVGNGNFYITPITLAPGETTTLDLDILPRKTPGCAEMTIRFTDYADPGKVLGSADFDLCVNGRNHRSNEAEKVSLRIFPNPTEDYFFLSKNNSVRQLWISNILGKRVKTFNTYANSRYDLSELPDGMYLVSMVDARRNVIKTVRVSKRSPRP